MVDSECNPEKSLGVYRNERNKYWSNTKKSRNAKISS